MNLREFQRNKFKMIKARMMISSQGKPNLAKFYAGEAISDILSVSLSDYKRGTHGVLILIPVHVNLAEEKLMLWDSDTWQES